MQLGARRDASLIGSMRSRVADFRFKLRERLRGHPWDEAIRDLIYRNIGVKARQKQVQAANKPEADLDEYLRNHVCLMPFRSVETTNRGLAHVCCPDWLPTPFGKLDANLLDQWSGPMAKKIRASVLDGSYTYCSRLHCGEISNRQLHHKDSEEVRATLKEFEEAGDIAPPPKRIVLSHDRSCNLSCPSCRTSLILADKTKQARLDDTFDTAIAPLMRKAEIAYITSSGDPFGSNHFRRIIKRLDGPEFPDLKLDLHTNGQLFDERAWSDLNLAGRVKSVHVSVDAAKPETYAVIRRGGTFDRLRKNLAFIGQLRKDGKIGYLEISMVVQTGNFREMPAFVLLGQEFGVDIVSFQMMRNLGTFSDDAYDKEFVGGRSHPDHEEFVEILKAPELQLPMAKIGNMLGYV
jgi:wyosine [tRNA(Phe)-imidazoG37] synthetase (radical SAM superfamily)